MDIDYILAALLLGSAALIAAFLIGFSKGRREGFRYCSRIWEGYYSPMVRPHRRTRSTDILDAEEIV